MSTNKKLSEKIISENLIKNFSIIILGFLFFNPIKSSLANLSIEATGDFLMIISILLVTACFANFEFTYKAVSIKKFSNRILSHTATFIFMLLTALLLEAMSIVIMQTYPALTSITIVFSVLLYIGLALYDFWDLFRATDQ